MTEINEDEIDYSAYAYNSKSKKKADTGDRIRGDNQYEGRRSACDYDRDSGYDDGYESRCRREYNDNACIDVTGEVVTDDDIVRVGSLSDGYADREIDRVNIIAVQKAPDMSAKDSNSIAIISKSIARLELPDRNIGRDRSYDQEYNYSRNAQGKQIKKGKSGRSGKTNFAIGMIAMLVCFGLVVVIADALSGGYIIDKAVGLFTGKVTSKTYYAIELASFDDPNSARLMSSEVRAAGAGGYVINDDIYRVIAEVYPSKGDALSVSAKLNLNGYVTSIYEIRIGEVNYDLFPVSTRNSTKKIIKYADEMYESLFDISTKIDKGVYDFVGAKTAVKELSVRIDNMLVDYVASVDEQIDNENVHKVRMQVTAVVGALDNISTESTSARDMVSDVRYISCMILNTHRAMIAGMSVGAI